jgi:hypothetical protein
VREGLVSRLPLSLNWVMSEPLMPWTPRCSGDGIRIWFSTRACCPPSMGQVSGGYSMGIGILVKMAHSRNSGGIFYSLLVMTSMSDSPTNRVPQGQVLQSSLGLALNSS